jgi:hypothetical protein
VKLFTTTVLYAVCPVVERKRESGKSEMIVYQKTRSEKLKGRVRQVVRIYMYTDLRFTAPGCSVIQFSILLCLCYRSDPIPHKEGKVYREHDQDPDHIRHRPLKVSLYTAS